MNTAHARNDYAPPLEHCANDADRNLRIALNSAREEPLPVELISEEALSYVRANENEGYTISELRAALECPFQFQMRHRLKSAPRGEFERWNLLPSLPRKAALAAQPTILHAERALNDGLAELLDRMAPETGDWERRLVAEGADRVFKGWLAREEVARQTWPKTNVQPNYSFAEFNSRENRPSGLRLKGAIDAVSDFGAFRVAHIYTARSLGESWEQDLNDAQTLEIGLMMLAIYEPGRRLAVEMEGVSERRILFVLGRSESDDIISGPGLVVRNLIEDNSKDSKEQFMKSVRELAKRALAVAQLGRINATPGDHCTGCAYADLCRSSKETGEFESAFEAIQEEE